MCERRADTCICVLGTQWVKATATARAALLPSPTSACWVFSCFRNPPNTDMDYRIFNMRTWSLLLLLYRRGWAYRQRVSTTVLTRKKSFRFLVLLTGFELGPWTVKSDALPTEPPRRPLSLVPLLSPSEVTRKSRCRVRTLNNQWQWGKNDVYAVVTRSPERCREHTYTTSWISC